MSDVQHDDTRPADAAFIAPDESLALGARMTERLDLDGTVRNDGAEFPGGAAGDGRSETASGGAPES